MTKKLEELFDLPPSESIADHLTDTSHLTVDETRSIITTVDSAIDKIDAALPLVRDLETGDDELDELAKLATEKFEDLMDLGMNMDPRFAGVVLQSASTLLGHAITAKTAKIDKKLKMVQLDGWSIKQIG